MSLPDSTLPAPWVGANGTGGSALPAGPFRPRLGVLTARALDAMALYEPSQERYFTFNPVATRIWEGLDAGQLPGEIADRLSGEYDVPVVQVLSDVTTQLSSWLRDSLIEQGVAARRLHLAHRDATQGSDIGVHAPQVPHARDVAGAVPAEIRVPSVLRCGLTITRIKWLLRTRRFEGTIAWVRVHAGSIVATEAAELEAVRALEYAVAMAGAFYPARAKCLEQSLALYYLARRQGVAVRYCQGVQLYPFEAHAWIEYRGQVINDVPDHVKHFTRFPDRLP